jgi:L-aspartate oxidase
LSTAATRRRRKEEERLLVVGSGVAGCSAALIAAERYGIPVTLVYAGDAPTDCNSYWAQGGIIYRNYDPASNDSAESLVQDVHRAGAGLCKDSAVWKLALDGPDRVRELLLDPSGIFANVPFDRTADGELSCCLEASHAAPRIIHKADHTGKAITDHITAAALKHPLIQVLSNSIVTDLITTEQQQQQQQVCLGAMVMNKQTGQTQSITALHGTLLASGGLAGIYQHSTNPSGFNALGSSVALATRAGAHTSDLEYVQFHPTALYIPNESRFLLTEALRGEGAKLRDASGRAFAKDFHPDGELAPRDVVARGVFNELQKSADQHNVFLDITHRDADWLRGRFPSIDQHLQARGLDITKDVLPITPAAHYTCGGITTDLNGCTNVLGLYSAGEAARTGLHGGNRLASTSLLEGLVYGAAVADYVGKKSVSLLEMSREQQHIHGTMNTEIQEDYKRRQQQQQSSNDAIVERAQDLLHHLKRVMWDHVGVVRTPEGLSKAATELSYIREEAYDLFDSQPCMQTSALRDAVIAGQAVTTAALSNRVSAGAHCIVLDEVLRTDEDEDYTDDEEEDVALASVTN